MSCGHTARLSALISLCLYAPLRTFAGNALKQKGATKTAPFLLDYISIGLLKALSRKALLSTKMLEKAMAPAAKTGDNSVPVKG